MSDNEVMARTPGRRTIAGLLVYTRAEMDVLEEKYGWHESRFYYKQEAKRHTELLSRRLLEGMKLVDPNSRPTLFQHQSMFWAICLGFTADGRSRYVLGDHDLIILEPITKVDPKLFRREKRKRGR